MRLMSFDNYDSGFYIFERFNQFILIRIYDNFDVLVAVWAKTENSSFVSSNIYLIENAYSKEQKIRKLNSIEIAPLKEFDEVFLFRFKNKKLGESNFTDLYFVENGLSMDEVFKFATKCFTDLHTFLSTVYGNGNIR